jgi:hypothetical protein
MMEDAEEELNLVLSTEVLSIDLLKSFWILVAKFAACVQLYVLLMI